MDQRRISIYSLLGKGLLGSAEGDKATVAMSDGSREYEIVNIAYTGAP
ncbi:GreA/GreB family elongation factor [Streptomyces sp. NPDC051994]